MAENFDLIFGQSAGSQYAWSDSDYQNGWSTVGSTPPTAEQFDALQRRADTKAQELNNNLAPLVEQNTANNRQPLTAYALKDIRYSPLLPTGWFLECTTAGTTDNAEITLPSPLVENATITDGTVVWKVRKIGSGGGEAIGVIKAFAGNGAIPSGYLLCDGAAYSRTALPDLFAAIGTDYGAGDGSTTFNVPDANQAKRFLQGDTVAGTVKTAGLPNIEGHFQIDPFNASAAKILTTSGAFFSSSSTSTLYKGTYSGNYTGSSYALFNASNSNSIYGNSTTVQPPALTTRYIIKAFDGQTADSALIDITQYENELAHKADQVNTAGAHNSIWRGKDLTSYFDSGEMSADIAAENWKNIYVGDYITKSITIDGTTYSNVKFIVMDLDYHLHCGDTETTAHHVVIMPEEALGSAQMNTEHTTTGGYLGSKMWTKHMPKVTAGFEAAFGAAHILEHRELLSNAMDANLKSNAYDGWSGAASGWAWVSVKANLANEDMVYGAPILSSSLFDTGECNSQLAAFRLNHGLICSKRYWWWLRSVANASLFCGVYDGAHAASADADASGGVRPIALLY